MHSRGGKGVQVLMFRGVGEEYRSRGKEGVSGERDGDLEK